MDTKVDNTMENIEDVADETVHCPPPAIVDYDGDTVHISNADDISDNKTEHDELISKFQHLMKSKMNKKTFDLRKHAERLSREDNILKQRDGIFTFLTNRSKSILASYWENPKNPSIIVSPWKIFNRETGDREEIGNRFEIFKWTLKFRSSKAVPFNISSYFRDKDRREQMIAGLTQEFQKLLGNNDVHFRIFYASKQRKSRDSHIDIKNCTFHLNLHIPYSE